MAKRYQQLNRGLVVPDWFPSQRQRSRIDSRRHFIFTPGGGPCRCGISCWDCTFPEEYLVNLGDGGLTPKAPPDGCSNCVDLQGYFVLTYNSSSKYGYSRYCEFSYGCVSGDCIFEECNIGIFAALIQYTGATPNLWYWWIRADLWKTGYASGAFDYVSSEIESDTCPASLISELVTLSPQEGGLSEIIACNGVLPETITIEPNV